MSDRDAWRNKLLAPVQRWTPARKAAVCMAIWARAVAIEEVLEAHKLERIEVEGWLASYATGGRDALYVSRRRRAA